MQIRKCIDLRLANPLTPYRIGSKSGQNREKRVSGKKKKTPFPIAPEKGALSPENPPSLSLQGAIRKMGIFGLKAPFSGAIGNGSLLTPKPSFPAIFGDFDPCPKVFPSRTLKHHGIVNYYAVVFLLVPPPPEDLLRCELFFGRTDACKTQGK